MWLIVGLGNPGQKYELTRHNIGFLVADALADKFGQGNFASGYHGKYAKAEIAGKKVIILKPETFMNLSGKAVQSAASFFKIRPENILLIHDELDLKFGDIRQKLGGGHAGHNGLRDTSRLLGPNYHRIRFGVGRPEQKGREADYVLQNFAADEMNQLEGEILRAEKLVIGTLSE